MGGFEDIVAGVVIDGSDFAFEEKVVFDGFNDVFWTSEVVVHDEATELGFDSKNTFVRWLHRANSYYATRETVAAFQFLNCVSVKVRFDSLGSSNNFGTF